MSSMKDKVYATLYDTQGLARTPEQIRRMIYPNYDSRLRVEPGRLAAVSRALNSLLREGLVHFSKCCHWSGLRWWRAAPKVINDNQ